MLGREHTPDLKYKKNEDKWKKFILDLESRIYLSYRMKFPEIESYTTDTGWGCMYRTGQMMLAQAFVLYFLGRDWRIEKSTKRELMIYLNIIRWYGDDQFSPYSIHKMTNEGYELGLSAGQWHSPTTVSLALRNLVSKAHGDYFNMYVTQDSGIYLNKIKELGKKTNKKSTLKMLFKSLSSKNYYHDLNVTKRNQKKVTNEKGISITLDKNVFKEKKKNQNQKKKNKFFSENYFEIIQEKKKFQKEQLELISNPDENILEEFHQLRQKSKSNNKSTEKKKPLKKINSFRKKKKTTTQTLRTSKSLNIPSRKINRNNGDEKIKKWVESNDDINSNFPIIISDIEEQSEKEFDKKKKKKNKGNEKGRNKGKKKGGNNKKGDNNKKGGKEREKEKEKGNKEKEKSFFLDDFDVIDDNDLNGFYKKNSLESKRKTKTKTKTKKTENEKSKTKIKKEKNKNLKKLDGKSQSKLKNNTNIQIDENKISGDKKLIKLQIHFPDKSSKTNDQKENHNKLVKIGLNFDEQGKKKKNSKHKNKKAPFLKLLKNDFEQWKPTVIFIPVRLGMRKFNENYIEPLTEIMKFPQSIGIVGGKTNSSLYFVAIQEDNFYFLDPHKTQECVNTYNKNIFDTNSYHQNSIYRLKIKNIDPSMVLGFLIKNLDDLNDFIERSTKFSKKFGTRSIFSII
ncbi:cysteine protease atg4 [Anaeramoeba flamelloides]|uniref:Cysteine protease n=1 Tax=Anaeramoeba flamelloides TaxID=1746091 RepID=A0AAV7ZIK2_9EUKA|nr:cysteine protease atg4 [Anaeramoeba flamelloides]